MTVKEQVRKQYKFKHRETAVTCAKQEIDDTRVGTVTFTNCTWLKEEDPDKYQVDVTYLEVTR